MRLGETSMTEISVGGFGAGSSPREKRLKNQVQRVVAGQRLMEDASDIFLGGLRGPTSRDFYCRQLRDLKGSAKIERMSPDQLVLYAGICSWALARAPARSGDRVQIAAYLGASECFDSVIADFAEACADQNE